MIYIEATHYGLAIAIRRWEVQQSVPPPPIQQGSHWPCWIL